MPPIRVLELSGSHYEMGYQHGLHYTDQIREIAEERLQLCTEEIWTGRQLPREQVLELAGACVEYHFEYAPDQMEQMVGMSAATGLSIPELVIANGFTDFVDVIYNTEPGNDQPATKGNECTSFLVANEATANQQAMLGQTWDMHASATPYVILLKAQPKDEPALIAFTITGCIGMIGMNEAGIAVGINNLVMKDGQPGVTWPFVCRKILAQTNIEDALQCILTARLAGGHNYVIMDNQGKGFNIEATTTSYQVKPLDNNFIAHANQCLGDPLQDCERPLTIDLLEDSKLRLNRAYSLLENQPHTPETLMALTRDRSDGAFSICSHSEPPFYSETCCAVVMRPATRELWGVWGLPSKNEFERFAI